MSLPQGRLGFDPTPEEKAVIVRSTNAFLKYYVGGIVLGFGAGITLLRSTKAQVRSMRGGALVFACGLTGELVGRHLGKAEGIRILKTELPQDSKLREIVLNQSGGEAPSGSISSLPPPKIDYSLEGSVPSQSEASSPETGFSADYSDSGSIASSAPNSVPARTPRPRARDEASESSVWDQIRRQGHAGSSTWDQIRRQGQSQPEARGNAEIAEQSIQLVPRTREDYEAMQGAKRTNQYGDIVE
ncbi:uncharacterized protein BJ171DRAFT_505706 [Polychytrium aggregatum]|uniref:uncharacterized protein n=1 Tax=Polychytrium aggregatum TaxID=110093 RepID=UPI0022FE8840|nr:uncharacterized protein BJ171DRAFT_505706 [Polychytrium aggregatum]KAI9204400.1 hypothetical protein BJ171DRAFT_505706 [Polychytrium aggregatum]